MFYKTNLQGQEKNTSAGTNHFQFEVENSTVIGSNVDNDLGGASSSSTQGEEDDDLEDQNDWFGDMFAEDGSDQVDPKNTSDQEQD